jgi:D-alanyl-D-alanine carboxypeptidase/D-alanyl-D-alanine-endopeptidase (penicillin-binding protein 4)
MKATISAFLFCVFLGIHAPLSAQSLDKKIEKAFSELEGDPNIKNGIVSLTVMDANSGVVVFAKNEQIGLATASTLKTITTATAYSVLGKDFRYHTDLSYTGEIDANGTLKGDLILKGSGDPTLGSDRFPESNANVLLQRWVSAVKAQGIKRIEGRVIGDDLLFNGHQAPGGWTWVDMGNYYGAGVSSLNWRENTFNVVLSAGANVGDPVELIGTEPRVSYLTILNEVTTGEKGSGDQVYAYSAPYSSIIHLRGSYGIDLNKKISLSLPNGAYDVAVNLQSCLLDEGIAVEEPASTAFLMAHADTQIPAQTHLLDRYESPALSQIAHWFNRISINLYGEALLKTIALHVDENPTTQDMVKWEEKFWEEKLGIQPGELRIRDGSGLSPETRVTTLAMTKIMNYAKAQPWFGDFYENLPLYNNMKMKSGTISGVLGYTGYQTTSDGRPLVFSLLINNYRGSAPSMRQKMFKMLNSLK